MDYFRCIKINELCTKNIIRCIKNAVRCISNFRICHDKIKLQTETWARQRLVCEIKIFKKGRVATWQK